MFAYSKTGLDLRSKAEQFDFATLDDVIMNDLGGRLVSAVTKGDSYSLLTRKGQRCL